MDSVTRETLYAEVWAEPMTKVALRYQVSSSYLARVCTALEIPRPERGYRAKLEHGHKVRRPPLPDAPAGIPNAWTPGMAIPEHRPTERTKRIAGLQPRSAWTPRPARHPLVVGTEESFSRSYPSHLGYLRPYKRKLPDLYVSKYLLSRALDAASELYLRFEDARCPVGFAPSEYLTRRIELNHRTDMSTRKHEWNEDKWEPRTATVVLVNKVSFGLTVYELSELVAVDYGKDYRSYVRIPEPKKLRYPGQTIHREEMPSGRLALRAYCAHRYADWQQTWRVETPEELPGLARKILGAIQRAVPDLAKTIAERTEVARQESEKRQREWDEYRRREEEKARIAAEKAEQERRRAALEGSRRDLAALVDDWAFARRVEEFFADAERRAAALDDDGRQAIRKRLERARELLGNLDTLERFRAWKAPEER